MSELRLQLIGSDPETEGRLRRRFERSGVRIAESIPLHDAASRLANTDPDVVLLDAGDGGAAAVEGLVALKSAFPELPVILLAAEEDVASLAGAVRGGVFDVVPKPLDLTRLDLAIKNASQMHRLLRRVQQLQERGGAPSGYRGIVGESSVLRDVIAAIEQVARTDVGVILVGESGTGKGLVARTIHDSGERRARSFEALHAAAIPPSLLESEFFGHEVDAVEGATSPYSGLCERADGGTLFIAELCDLALDVQASLLQFLRTGTYRRLGGAATMSADVRVIGATATDPATAIAEGRLREDLYYQLNVVTIATPPLRRRSGDVALLAKHFLSRFSGKYGRFFQGFDPDALAALGRHAWPGNVRELENVIERIVVLYDGPTVTARMLPSEVMDAAPRVALDRHDRGPDEILPFVEIERREIVRALRICDGNVSYAAERLGIGQATLYRKIKKFGLGLRRGARETVADSPRSAG
jgi:DNA-binding NtrC family response regulator